MALTIRSEEHIKYENGVAVVRGEFDVDTLDELPMPAEINGKRLCQGSTALVISDGLLAVLTGDGKWRNCSGKIIKG